MTDGEVTEPGEITERGQITVRGLTKHYRSVKAVDDLSFTVTPGRVTGFLGPNAAGKTTTLRMLLGLVAPTAGEATIGGVQYDEIPEPTRTVGAVLEASSAHKGRTGRNHLRVIAAAAGLPDTRVDEVLELVGLTSAARRKFRGYSLGMRQRLGIAAALLGDPQVLILDEPANGLDPVGIRWMRDLLRGLADQGRTVLVSSHLLSEMQQLADDVLIIAHGRLVTQGPVEVVIDSLAQQGVRVRTPDPEKLTTALTAQAGVSGQVVAESPPPADAPTPPQPVVRRAGADLLQVTGLDAPAIGRAALTAGVELHELTPERPDLEHVFLELTNGLPTNRTEVA
ncbi:MAG: ABC transporter ATP-binding protein [Micromonosporaceae bacterium]